MAGAHGRSSYLVDRGGTIYRVERGQAAAERIDFTPAAALSGEETFAYKQLIEDDPAEPPSLDALDALGAAMMADAGGGSVESCIPAGYTYLGQFIFHDITFLSRESALN